MELLVACKVCGGGFVTDTDGPSPAPCPFCLLKAEREKVAKIRGRLKDAMCLVDQVNPGGSIFDNNFRNAPGGVTLQMVYDRICEEVNTGDSEWPSVEYSILGLREKLSDLEARIERGGFDQSPCMGCGEIVICIPDGLPFCKKCAEENT